MKTKFGHEFKFDELLPKKKKNKSNLKPWKSVYKLCWYKIAPGQKCIPYAKWIIQINHWNVGKTGRYAKVWPFVYAVDFWHWMQFQCWFLFDYSKLGELCWTQRTNWQTKKRTKKPSKNKMKSLRKPQIKISTTLKGCKYKLVAIPFRSYESNWFSWSANIYTCILQYKAINSILIQIRFYSCMKNVILSVSLPL